MTRVFTETAPTINLGNPDSQPSAGQPAEFSISRMRHNLLVFHTLLLACAVWGACALPGCRGGAQVARRDRSGKSAAIAASRTEESQDARPASDTDQSGEVPEQGAVARAEPPSKSRRFIPDWLRFGDHESVPLPTTPNKGDEAEPPAESVDNFQ
jgi:hypothetical protein